MAILRDPAERAFSHFLRLSIGKRETLVDFSQAIEKEHERIQQNYGWMWHYVQRGFYYKQLENYIDIFDKNQLKICLYEDLKASPNLLCKDIFGFLGVNDSYIPDTSIVYAESLRIPKNRIRYSFLEKPILKTILKPFIPKNIGRNIKGKITRQSLVKPSLPLETREYLIKIYKKDILKLQDFLQRDLSKWLEVD